ncbi:hypothetical protein FOFC_05493 [Fusarium oxysporum]|nr:hypothetical protein FOFC_05493 [Fusarium oxysporum]
MADKNKLEAEMAARAAAVSQQVREALQSSLPVAPEQMMTVQIPGTVINAKEKGPYWFNPKEHAETPHRIKVHEARLVDGMVPLSKIMMGPTGKSVARSYAAALDMLIPEDAPIDMDTSTVAKSKAAERYLAAMKYLTSTVPNSSKTVVDVYVEKQQIWSDAMKDWDRAKNAARDEAKRMYPQEIEKQQWHYDEWNQANFRNYKNHAQAKYMDWIVNGCKYKVDYNFGIVDVSSAMKRVESSKEASRNLVVIDPDGTTEWQEVTLEPSDWNRQASGTSKRTAEQAELSPIHREGLPLIGLQLRTPINPQESILLGTPIATSTRAGTPITSRPGPSIASQEGVRLGTPIESPVSSPSIWPRPARERHSRPPVQLQQSAIERPVMERRDFELPDPDWMRDLSHCPLSDRDKELLEKFWTELENDRMEHCARCQETWFDMGLKGGICKRCIARDKNKKEDEPWFFSAENQLDFGLIPAFLPQLTIVEEMLIARVHVFVNVMQVRGQQYKYRGHIVHFLRDVGKVYSQLPLLPPELDVILLRPPTASEHAHLNRQFRRQFRVRRRCLQEWLNFLSNNHPGYRGITVCQKRMSVLPEDGDVLDQVATAAVTDPLSANLGNIENDDVEPDEVDQSAVPDLLPEDTEMEALRSHVLGEERGEHLPVRPSTQHQLEMPDIRRTPINEFNHSQALLSLAFPTLFPRGQADFVEPRLRPIKYADYIQHALRWHDGRFARHPTFRFVVFNTLMRAQARAKSSYFVKEYQQRQGLITRDDLLEAFQNPESAEAQQLLNSINRQTAQLRGTRPYWYRKRRELESYAYNLDCPGAFITFSPADLHWRSLYQHLPQFQDWQELPEQQRMGMSSKLLRDNPHIAAWHFYRRFGLFRDIVLKQKFNVTDYWNRYEWQGRGSSHCHGLFWMDGAPSVDLENEHLRKEFARIWRFHVTAFNPEPARVRQQGEGNPLAVNPLQHPLTFQWLSQVLNRCQRHHCSETYCLRKKKGSEEISCRFFFPRDTRDTADVVRRQGQSYFSFEAARNDSLMNHYNRCLSLGWLANIDISPCTSLQAVINYAAKYCSKMEKRTDSYASMGRQILPYVSHQNPLLSFASRLMNKLLTERDFSGQEICHVLLNCELQEGTRVIRAVDCRPYEQQGRSLRLQGDHDDAEVVGIYEKYLSRPPLHEELTYLDFLANWNTSKRDGRKWTRWSRQAKPRVLYYFPRYKSNHQHHQYDDFCRVKLMLAHPHRDPNELRKINGVEYNSYASAAEFCYGNHRHPDDYYGTPNAEERRPDPDEFEEEFHEPDLLEEDWLELARQLPDCPPSQEAIDLLGRRDIDIQYDWTPHVGRYADPGIVQGDYWRQRIEQNRLYMDVEDMPLEVRDALNSEQRIVYDTFIGHFQCGSEEQILLHVDGGGGTGKSYMVKVLSSHLQRLAGNRPSPIWRAAPTGVASNQIMGTTLHSLLRLPVDRAFTELSPADANAVQNKLRDVRYLVIDEKSMLGLRQLSWIDKRLRQVFPARAAEFFGGISIILVGDFFQLPPIANKPLYFDGPLKDLHEVSGQTAYRAFNHTVFLKKVQRQQGDDQAGFRLALEELRGLKLSIESWKLLSQRVQVKLSQREEDTFDAALRIYSKKARVNEYNYEHLVRLKHPAIQVMAKNIGNGADKATSEQAGNLAGQFPVCIGARLMLTQNIWQPAGLVNGAQGTVYDIGWAPGADAHRDPPSVIMMVMDKYTGPSYLTTDDGREVVPILPVKRDFFLGTSACTRKQFPLMASYAITVHKSQSITVDKMVTDLSERDFQTGLSYVAVSRVKMLDGLMIDAPFERASLHYEKLPDGKHSSIMLFTLEALQVYADCRNGLPSHELADRLVDAYFDHVHVLYPFLHEGRFRARYEALWAEETNSNCAEPTVWLAIVNLVFAYGYEFCAGQQESFSVLAAPFADRAKAMVLSHVFTSTSIELVQALLLLCHYLQSTLQLNECWNLVGLMIRGAVSIGLHLNPVITDGETSMVEKEERKRAWWGCFVLDRTLSMKFGRPPSIIFDDAKNVDLPLQVDDQYIGETSSIPRQPWGRPSRLSFFTHTIKLSEVVGNILSNMYNMGSRKSQVESMWWSYIPEDSTKLGNVVLLDGQLQAWWDDMPGHLKDPEFKIGPMKNLLEGRDFQRQRLVMRIRFLQMRLLLQRPCFILLSKNKIQDDLRRGVALSSAQVCMSVARETIQLIHLHYDKQLLNSLWYNLHYVFTSLGVLVTAQTLEEPLRSLVWSNEDAQALHDGMKFLRSAGRNSGLASRYVAMLSKANTVPPLQSDRASNSLVTGNTQEQPEGNGGFAINEEVILVDTTSGMGSNETQQQQESCCEQGKDGLETAVADFDFARLDFNNPLDLLFGTGLPQDFLLTDWTTDEAMIL